MEVVRERALDKALVAFQLVYISKSTFNQDAIFEGQQPLIIKDGVEEYKIAGQIIRRFVGLDGGVARVTEGLHIYKASHLFNYEIDVRYQYTLEHESVKEMDDFAVTFLQKITRK
ncbi:hypothetical protein K2E96_11650 [Pseudomonas sp. ERGC3:05]|nr:hypothetical protein [Pseudomonas sp. ERGC3:01]QZC96568.1 hypothetical protein K2E96_11650 [Pseudomonas sp. ERGC3:05]